MKFQNRSNSIILILIVIATFLSCQKDETIEVTPKDFTNSIDNLTEIIIHDIFSPPVASRIYCYPNIAAYEIIAQNSSTYQSLQNQLNGLDSIPNMPKDAKINKNLAALIAHLEVSKQLIFSEEIVVKYRDSLYQKWSKQNIEEFEASKNYALKVAERIIKWMGKDNYKQTRTMPKYSVFVGQEGRWQPTPPAYMDGIEPHWGKIRTMVLDSASQFKPEPPHLFSTDKNSPFFKEALEVYEISKILKQKGDKSEEIKIAQFWDCNPYVTVTQGHMMFAKKKITPGGHWMGITKVACFTDNADFEKTVYANTATSIGLFEAFISCWDEKYRSNLVRPETVINKHIDENWMPLLQTPPFPEYTSGHSVASSCSGVILSTIFGEKFTYIDNTEIAFGLPERKYYSFKEAAKEAAISRFYAGIHYKKAIENGITQGNEIGEYIIKKIKFLKK